MRATACFVALLLVLPLLPLGAAQGAEPLLTDAAGDVEATVGVEGTSQTAPVPANRASDVYDLLALEVEEDLTSIRFTLQIAGFDDQWTQVSYGIHLTWDDTPYRLDARVGKSDAIGFSGSMAWLYRGDEDDRYRRVVELPHTVDEANGRVTLEVPKLQLQNQNGRIPVVDSTLTNVYVTSGLRWFGGTFQNEIRDRMPDGEDGASYTLSKGNVATGHLRLFSADPVRVSNGGSTTIVFEATVHNDGAANDEVTLEVSDAPADWDVQVYSPVKVPAGGKTPVHAIATIPFKHQHGGFDSLNLTATSGVDPNARAIATFGVLHTPVPQPAGHHPDLYLHAEPYNEGHLGTLFPWAATYMNTDADHEHDAEGASPNSWRGDGYGWRIPLGPALAMGLDFLADEDAILTGAIRGRATGEADVTAELVLVVPGDDPYDDDDDRMTTLARASSPAAVTLDVTGDTPFELALTPTDEADYVPYDPEQNLVLYVNLDSDGFTLCCMPQTSPLLLVEPFKLTLPLEEYRDQAPVLQGATVGPQLTPTGPTEKAAQPGAELAYGFTLTNAGAAADRFTLQVTGQGAEHATLTPAGTVTLAPGESKSLVLTVHVPEKAAKGAAYEALVLARSTSDPSLLAIGSTLTTVQPDAAQDAESDELIRAARDASEKESPTLGALAAVGTLALLGVARRRR